MSAFRCQHCNAVCDWESREPTTDENVAIKCVASRYCNKPECIMVEQRECNCQLCRHGVVHHQEMDAIAYDVMIDGKPYTVRVTGKLVK